MWLWLSIYMVLTALVHQKAHQYLVVALQMKSFVTVPEDVVRIFCTYLPIKAAITIILNTCNQASLRWTKMQDRKSLTLHWRSLSKWGRVSLACSLSNNGGQHFVDDCIWHLALRDYTTHIPNNHWRSIEADCQHEVWDVYLCVLIMNAAMPTKMDCDVQMSLV